MKLTKKILREANIINSWDIGKIAHNRVILYYEHATHDRLAHCATWQVSGIGFKTNPEAAWYDHGCKTFIVHDKNTEEAFQEAQKWCQEHHELTGTKPREKWERDPHGNYHPEGTLAKIENFLKDGRNCSMCGQNFRNWLAYRNHLYQHKQEALR